MVEPSASAETDGAGSRWRSGCAGLSAGCCLVPKSRLDECHRLSQTLQAENARLKDTPLSLRSQNQDLNQRAVDDARRLRCKDEAIERLEQSVLAYQSEREQAGRGRSTGSSGRSGTRCRPSSRNRPRPHRCRRHCSTDSRPSRKATRAAQFDPQWRLDASGRAGCSSRGPTGSGSKPEAGSGPTASLLRDPEARDVGLLVVGRTDAAPVRRAGLNPQPPPKARASGPRPGGPGPRPARDRGRDRRRPDRGGRLRGPAPTATGDDGARADGSRSTCDRASTRPPTAAPVATARGSP